MKKLTLAAIVVLSLTALSGCAAAPKLLSQGEISQGSKLEVFDEVTASKLRGSYANDCPGLDEVTEKVISQTNFLGGQQISSDTSAIWYLSEINLRAESPDTARQLAQELGFAAQTCDKGITRYASSDFKGADYTVAWSHTLELDLLGTIIEFYDVSAVSSRGPYLVIVNGFAERATGLRTGDLVDLAKASVAE